jgi:hypothetical protein
MAACDGAERSDAGLGNCSRNYQMSAAGRFFEKILCGAQAYFLSATGALGTVRHGDHGNLRWNLPSFAVKAFPVEVRPELISARFLRW